MESGGRVVRRCADDRSQAREAIGADRARGNEIGNRCAQLLVVEIARRGQFIGKRRAVNSKMIEEAVRKGPPPIFRAGPAFMASQTEPRIRMLAKEQRNRGGPNHLRRPASARSFRATSP